jgi:hypothetical protein
MEMNFRTEKWHRKVFLFSSVLSTGVLRLNRYYRHKKKTVFFSSFSYQQWRIERKVIVLDVIVWNKLTLVVKILGEIIEEIGWENNIYWRNCLLINWKRNSIRFSVDWNILSEGETKKKSAKRSETKARHNLHSFLFTIILYRMMSSVVNVCFTRWLP